MMKMSAELERLMIEQVRNEIWSGYVYLGMSSAMGARSFTGSSKWLKKQAQEEVEHGMKFYDYLTSRGATIQLLPIGEATTDYDSPLSAFSAALEHERKVTEMIHKMYDLAVEKKDYESQQFLDWFISEQVEEEEHAQYFVDRFTIAGDNISAILQIDTEAGARE